MRGIGEDCLFIISVRLDRRRLHSVCCRPEERPKRHIYCSLTSSVGDEAHHARGTLHMRRTFPCRRPMNMPFPARLPKWASHTERRGSQGESTGLVRVRRDLTPCATPGPHCRQLAEPCVPVSSMQFPVCPLLGSLEHLCSISSQRGCDSEGPGKLPKEAICHVTELVFSSYFCPACPTRLLVALLLSPPLRRAKALRASPNPTFS